MANQTQTQPMTEIISEKWKLAATMTTESGGRIQRHMEVFAKGLGEARVTALNEWRDAGNSGIVVNEAREI